MEATGKQFIKAVQRCWFDFGFKTILGNLFCVETLKVRNRAHRSSRGMQKFNVVPPLLAASPDFSSGSCQ
jgi:hypothetical protein